MKTQARTAMTAPAAVKALTIALADAVSASDRTSYRADSRTSDRSTKLFDRLDADGASNISPDGMTAAVEARRDGRMAKRFERLAANGDGALARAGVDPMAAGAAPRRFRHFDANGDGLVTRDELQGSGRRGG